MDNKIVIFGTGEYAELAYYYFTNDSEYEVVAFTADNEFIKSDSFLNLPLVPVDKICELFPPNKFKAHVALSYRKLNQTRQEKFSMMKDLGYSLVSYVCSKSVTWPDLTIGENCFILENQTIQPTVKIGDNVMIWSGNHLGHNCSIGDHTYISSHVCISGHVKIGERCFLGVNATAADFIKIGNDCFIGMGASVVKDLQDGDMILCAKSNVFAKDSELNKKVMRSYFKKEI
tara:strand:+ start:1225 stop:1917 length:693 start_codon:yes stop_codon:yes gene_type:complete